MRTAPAATRCRIGTPHAPLRAVVLLALFGTGAACGSSGSIPTSPVAEAPVSTAAYTSLAVTGLASIDQLGQALPLAAVAGRADGTTQVVTELASWTSSNPSAVSIASTGVATAIDVGTTVITAGYRGMTATLPVRVGAPVVCSSYIPTALTITPASGLFIIENPLASEWLDSYTFESSAQIALAVFQRYRNYCAVGRDNRRLNRDDYVVSYWLNQYGLSTTIDREDCEPYDPRVLQIFSRGAAGWAVTANGRDLQLLDTVADATTIMAMMGHYSNQCYIGRGTEPRLTPYWK